MKERERPDPKTPPQEAFQKGFKEARVFATEQSRRSRIRFVQSGLFVLLILGLFTTSATLLRGCSQRLSVLQKAEPTLHKGLIAKEIVLQKPRLEGTDKHGQPYTILADHAVQKTKDADTLLLYGPQLSLQEKRGGSVVLTAQSGIYTKKTQQLFLKKATVFFENQHMTGTFESLHVDIRQALFVTDRPLSFKGVQMELKSNALRAEQKKQHFYFSKGVHCVFYDHPAAFSKGAKVAAEQNP